MFSGIMNMIFLTSMMSFMGMMMNPAETNIIGETDNTEIGESQSPADDTGSSENVDGNFGGFGDGGDFSF
jgi:hypothetical protein